MTEPTLTLDELRSSLHLQLEAHGLRPGSPEYAAAWMGAVNAIMALWLEYQRLRAERAEGMRR
jgi:hypothetical protein